MAREKSEPFEDIDGRIVEFENRTYRIKILPKPETVIVDDGARRMCEPLPDHLKGDEWYSALNLETKRTMWLHHNTYDFSPLE